MKNLITFALLTLATLVASAQTTPTINVLNNTIRIEWNALADVKIGFGLQAADKSGYLFSANSPSAAINQLQEDCGCNLSADDKLAVAAFYDRYHNTDTSKRVYLFDE